MNRLFLLAMAFIVTLGAAIGTLLFVSLIPFFHAIGLVATGALFVLLACGVVLVVSFTYTRVSIMLATRNHSRLMSRVVQFGDGGAAALDHTGQWVHLSSVHEQAKVPLPQTIVQSLPSPKKPDPWTDEATILELWQTGNTLQTICESTGMPYNVVQRVTSEAKKSGVKRTRKSDPDPE
jgi:hypothetical protein